MLAGTSGPRPDQESTDLPPEADPSRRSAIRASIMRAIFSKSDSATPCTRCRISSTKSAWSQGLTADLKVYHRRRGECTKSAGALAPGPCVRRGVRFLDRSSSWMFFSNFPYPKLFFHFLRMFFPLFVQGRIACWSCRLGKRPGVPTCRRSCLVVKPATCLSILIVSMSSGRSTAGVSTVFGSVNGHVSVYGTQRDGLRIQSSVLMRISGVLLRTGVAVNGSGRRRVRHRRRTAAMRLQLCCTW